MHFIQLQYPRIATHKTAQKSGLGRCAKSFASSASTCSWSEFNSSRPHHAHSYPNCSRASPMPNRHSSTGCCSACIFPVLARTSEVSIIHLAITVAPRGRPGSVCAIGAHNLLPSCDHAFCVRYALPATIARHSNRRNPVQNVQNRILRLHNHLYHNSSPPVHISASGMPGRKIRAR